jgi:dihydrolipoamide dehydrogenase
MMIYEVAIIGGGPAGYTAAQKAATAGRSTLLFEKNALGGVCLNEGCIPTKTLLCSAKKFDQLGSAQKYAVEADNIRVDLPRIIARKNKVVKKLAAGIRKKMSEAGVQVVTAEAQIAGRSAAETFLIAAEGQTYEARHLILCTGSETIVPPIPGLNEATCWSSREALMAKERPRSLVVIGGGVVGMEFASFFQSLGAEVSVVEMLDEILPGMDREAVSTLRAEYARKGMQFYTGHRVTAIDGDKVHLEKDGAALALQAEKILISVGRKPVLRGFGLETLGDIDLSRGGIKTDAYMRTSIAGVYACGDITGYSMLAHTAVSEAETAVRHLLGKDPKPTSYRAIPSVVYTDPELAGAGSTEDALRKEGVRHTVRKIPMTFSGRFVAENEMGNGLCKILLAKDDSLLGVHLVGAPASELIVIASIAIERGIKADELASFIFPHPTVGEILKEALG